MSSQYLLKTSSYQDEAPLETQLPSLYSRDISIFFKGLLQDLEMIVELIGPQLAEPCRDSLCVVYREKNLTLAIGWVLGKCRHSFAYTSFCFCFNRYSMNLTQFYGARMGGGDGCLECKVYGVRAPKHR